MQESTGRQENISRLFSKPSDTLSFALRLALTFIPTTLTALIGVTLTTEDPMSSLSEMILPVLAPVTLAITSGLTYLSSASAKPKEDLLDVVSPPQKQGLNHRRMDTALQSSTMQSTPAAVKVEEVKQPKKRQSGPGFFVQPMQPATESNAPTPNRP